MRTQRAISAAAGRVGEIDRCRDCDDVVGQSHAKSCADRAPRALRRGRSWQRAARLVDIHVESLLAELRDTVNARDHQPTGSVATVWTTTRSTAAGGSRSCGAWLDAFGDVLRWFGAVHVHPTLLRYRLRRLSEAGGIVDLDDAGTRLVATFQLRVIEPAKRA